MSDRETGRFSGVVQPVCNGVRATKYPIENRSVLSFE